MRACLLALLLGLLAACDPPAPAEPEPVRYTVVSGDTLSKIAKKHGVTVQALKAHNGLKGDQIEVGQVLEIPGGGEPVAQASGKKKRRGGGGSAGDAGSGEVAAPSGLSLPPAQPCLAGPDVEGAGDEPEMAASAGLSYEQVRSAMNRFLPTLQRCVPEGASLQGTLRLQIVVACSGRVASVAVEDAGGLDPALAECVRDTLRYAPFPAHDLPDGYTFEYPMRFSQG